MQQKEAVVGKKNGLNRCPNCGATDTTFDPATGKVRCNFCRTEFIGKKVNAYGGVEELQGRIVGDGAGDVIPSEDVILTFKCTSCGAEIVIDASESVSARCHWCRNTFSLNEKMPNGAVPDMVLPFKLEKKTAEAKIREFVNARKFFAHPQFKKEFTTENIMGVYLPYMIVDVNGHAKMVGEAEHLVRKYTVGSGDHKKTRYDADLYSVNREFDLLIDDLSVEASSDKLDQNIDRNTNNVINAIMPFDTENCEDWNPAYLKGFTSERRDTNIDALEGKVKLQCGDVARYQMHKDMSEFYNRGTKWTNEELTVKGSKWKSAYLPVWLYSYQQKDKNLLHYVAVNARTGETMGSIPINKSLLMTVSVIIETISIIVGFRIGFSLLGMDDSDGDSAKAAFFIMGISLTPGFLFYYMKLCKYRNMDKRHGHEKETKSEMKNLVKNDTLTKNQKGLSNARIQGENGAMVKGMTLSSDKDMISRKVASFMGMSGTNTNSFESEKKK